VTYTLRAGSGSAWITNKSGTAVQFTATQIGASGSPVPPVILSGLPSANALAFDGNGNLWIASGSSGNDEISEYTASQLSTTGSPTPALTLTSTNQSISLPQQIAFDLGGNLWVANQIAGTVVEFAASQLAGLSGSHALPPAVTLTSASWGANGVGTIAFDIHGTLWVYGFTSGKIGVYGYAASSLTGSGSVPATTVLTNPTFTSGPQTLLFDPSGHLWVTTNGTVAEFTAAQLAAGGNQAATVTIDLPGANAFINAAGFDDGGDLWVADGGSSAIFAYTATQLGTGGGAPPAITISSNNGSLSSPTAIGFDPHGIGVPLASRLRASPHRAY
jgi:ligand-binding sensor domain-containing protein